jgi:SAM-dependent methyltransferase
MATYALETGSIITYPKGIVLAPDIVTESLAKEAAATLNERASAGQRPHMLEVGIGAAAFSRYVLDLANVQLDVTGIDNNQEAINTAKANLEGHENLGSLSLAKKDWNSEDTFEAGPFDCVFFNPSYYRWGRKLREEFADSPPEAVYSQDPAATYRALLPRIVWSLAVGGIALVRYPGDGALTFAGDDAKVDHSLWVSFAEIDKTLARLKERTAWLDDVMPSDTKCFMWTDYINGRRVNAEMFTRIGDNIQNAPKLIRDMDAYWAAYN